MENSRLPIDPEIRKNFLSIPFGFLSGLSTFTCSISFLAVIWLVKYFQIFEWNETYIRIVRIGVLALDGLLVYYELAIRRVRSLFLKDQRDVLIVPNKNSAVLFAICVMGGFGDFLLIQKGGEFGSTLLNSVVLLIAARAIGALFLGWISDKIDTKMGLIFTILVPTIGFFILEFHQSLGLIPGKELTERVLAMQGFFGCAFVLVKRAFAISGDIKREGETIHGF